MSGRPRSTPIRVQGVLYWRCSRCREWLPPSRFNALKSRHSGLQAYCRVCASQASERHTKQRMLQRRLRRLEREAAKLRAELES